jgi:hypothetical protein
LLLNFSGSDRNGRIATSARPLTASYPNCSGDEVQVENANRKLTNRVFARDHSHRTRQ